MRHANGDQSQDKSYRPWHSPAALKVELLDRIAGLLGLPGGEGASGVGREFMYLIIDDSSRLAFAKTLADENRGE